jgi:hypothetical protein
MTKWERTDWWLSSDECLDAGLIDETAHIGQTHFGRWIVCPERFEPFDLPGAVPGGVALIVEQVKP